MKKKFLALCLFICLLSFPFLTYAQSQTVSITLNNLTYVPHYTPLLMNDTLYLSGYDLACMTYGTLNTTGGTFSLTIQNSTLTYDQKTSDCRYNNCRYIPGKPIIITDEQIIYFPLTVLDKFGCSYQYEGHQLKFSSLMPYSTATDQYKYHHLWQTDCPSYEELLKPLLKPEEIAPLLKETKAHDGYVSFITTANKIEIFKAIKKLMDTPPVTTVYMREINTSGDTPVLSDFRIFPLSYDIKDSDLTLNFNENSLKCSCFWAAYNPYEEKVSVDLEKSLDVMLMRTLYEYYRNAFNIKDNLQLTPITTITYGRSDSMMYNVYFEGSSKKQDYKVVIYKQSTAKTVNYYFDLIAD